METTLNLLQELSEVYSDEEREQNFLRILGNLSGVMSDRASVMKKYKEELNDAIKTTLGTQENIQFLYCNAHFLLGLSSTSDKTLKGVQAELKEDQIGRDPNPRFQRYSVTEAAAVRYIRMACEVLGPRGDEKNWCRDAWLACCSMSSQPSLVTSFKGNRFNNLFEAASALHFHRQHIVEFFTIYMADRNQKLESVLNDAESDSVAVFVLALALMYHRVTGSYWKLLGSKTHYLDFYQHVVELRALLEERTTDASTIFMDHLPPLFGQHMPEDDSYQAAVSVSEETKQKVIIVIQKLPSDFNVVLNRQLADFVPGGRYHAVTDPELRQKLAHSQITNLLGEACFGDLDLSIYKRRNASSHHHGSLTMMIRNKMMEKWFSKKEAASQKQILKVAAKKGPEFRKRHRQEERDVIVQRKLVLQECRQKHEELKRAQARKKDEIVRKLGQHSGPCKTPADVDRMLQRFHLQKEHTEALKLEMKYSKVILGFKSPLLKTTQTYQMLVDNLKHFLKEQMAGEDPQQQDRQREDPPPDDNVSEDLDEGPEGVGLSDSEQFSDSDTNTLSPDDFQFSCVGQAVAVFYDEDFHVVSVFSPDQADIKFLKKCVVTNNTYVWPSHEDRDCVERCYIFDWDFELTTVSGRIWTVPSHRSLKKKYLAFRLQYCWLSLSLTA